MTRLRIHNTTDLPTPLLREIVAAVRPHGIAGFDVEVRNSKAAFAGRAYTRGSGYHDRAVPFLVVRIGSERHFPLSVRPRGGYLPMRFFSRVEALVSVLAHELRHLWQGSLRVRTEVYHDARGGARIRNANRRRKGMVWGARGRYSERDADAYAIRSLRAWRRAHPVEIGPEAWGWVE